MDYQQVLNKQPYQVFIFSSPLPLPFSFAVHTWVVTNNNSKINRWEVWQTRNIGPVSWSHVHKNLFNMVTGMNIFYLFTTKRFKSRLIYVLEGDSNSNAKKVVDFIENKSPHYYFRNKYRYVPGPNSNTYVQWIINQFEVSRQILPWYAFGKNYVKHLK